MQRSEGRAKRKVSPGGKFEDRRVSVAGVDDRRGKNTVMRVKGGRTGRGANKNKDFDVVVPAPRPKPTPSPRPQMAPMPVKRRPLPTPSAKQLDAVGRKKTRGAPKRRGSVL